MSDSLVWCNCLMSWFWPGATMIREKPKRVHAATPTLAIREEESTATYWKQTPTLTHLLILSDKTQGKEWVIRFTQVKQARPVTYSMLSLDTLIIVCYDKGKTKTVSGWLALFLQARSRYFLIPFAARSPALFSSLDHCTFWKTTIHPVLHRRSWFHCIFTGL